MLQRLTLLVVVSSAIATSCGLLANSSPSSSTSNQSMPANSEVSIKSITLMARDESKLPPGQPPTTNRDIGFASVLLQLENGKEKDVDVIIQSVQIRSANLVGNVQMENQNTQTIHLHPLEHSASDIQLTNKTGLRGGKVKAIVTYKIGDRVQVIESSPVAINRG